MAYTGLPPGADALYAKIDSLKGQISTLEDQSNAAIRNKDQQAFDQYQAQAGTLRQQLKSTQDELTQVIVNDPNGGADGEISTPKVTTGQSQSTPAANARDDGPNQAAKSGGVGAGTSSNASNSRGNDNSPPASSSAIQQAINTTFAAQIIMPQPNVLDQYASYTYAISWWLLSPEQFNGLSTAGPDPNTGNWSLLMQSGGAPISGRNPAFPLDYYLDDLEIETVLAGKGTGMSTNGMAIRFKVVEPNGLTLLQNLFSAVKGVYKNNTPMPVNKTQDGVPAKTVNANQNSSDAQPTAFQAAQYCLTIEFYGYDAQGNLVAPATGNLSGSNSKAVIKKYYPFLIENITFRTIANQIEYMVTGNPVPYDTATSQARGTIPFAFALAGQTVGQILQGGPLQAEQKAPATTGRVTTPRPKAKPAPVIQPGIQPGLFASPIQATGNITQPQADALNLLAAGGMGA